MPKIYLSPSTQEFNPYITEGNEEYWMNLLADRMEPYLHASGVNTVRNDPAAVSLCQWHPLCAQHARHDRRVLHRAGEPPRRL